MLLIPTLIVLMFLNQLIWFKRARGTIPWYKDIWKPLFFTALYLLLIQAYT